MRSPDDNMDGWIHLFSDANDLQGIDEQEGHAGYPYHIGYFLLGILANFRIAHFIDLRIQNLDIKTIPVNFPGIGGDVQKPHGRIEAHFLS